MLCQEFGGQRNAIRNLKEKEAKAAICLLLEISLDKGGRKERSLFESGQSVRILTDMWLLRLPYRRSM